MAKRKAEKEAQMQARLAAVNSNDDKQRIMDQFSADINGLESQLSHEKELALRKLKLKQRQRRDSKKSKVNKQFEGRLKTYLTDQSVALTAIENEKKAADAEAANAEVDNVRVASEQALALDAQRVKEEAENKIRAQKEALLRRQREEEEQVERELEQQMQKERAEMEEKLAKKREHHLEALRRQAKEREAELGSLTGDELDARKALLLKNQENEMARLETSLGVEKEKARATLERRREQRRQRKHGELRDKNEDQLNKFKDSQNKQAAESLAKLQKASEEAIIKDLIAKNPLDARAIVRQVIEPRHQAALANMAAQTAVDKARAVRSALQGVAASFAAQRMELGVEPDQAKLDELDAQEAAEKSSVERNTLVRFEAEARLALQNLEREQALELDLMYEKFASASAPSGKASKFAEEEAARLQAELIQKEMEDEMERIKKEKEDELAQLSAEVDREKEQEALRLAEARAKFEQQRKEEKAIEDQKVRQKIEALRNDPSITNEQKQTAIDRYYREVDTLLDALNNQRLRQQEDLDRKRTQRREARAAVRRKQIEAESLRRQEELAQKQRADKAKLEEERQRALAEKTAAQFLRTASMRALNRTQSSMLHDSARLGSRRAVDATKVTEEDILRCLKESTLFEKVVEVERVLKEQKEGPADDAEDLPVDPATLPPAYHDPKEEKWSNNGPEISAMSQSVMREAMEKLPPNFWVVYRFADFVQDTLRERAQLKTVNVLCLPDLPPNDYTRNAFRNSYVYDVRSRTLFMRQERLEDAGEFVLVLIHALAHIHSMDTDKGDMKDDTRHSFLRSFHMLLKIVCEELFLARTKRKLNRFPHNPVSKEDPLNKAFNEFAETEARSLAQELIQVKSMQQEPPTAMRLVNRVQASSQFNVLDRLRALWQELDDNIVPVEEPPVDVSEPKNARELQERIDTLTADYVAQLKRVGQLGREVSEHSAKLTAWQAKLDHSIQSGRQGAQFAVLSADVKRLSRKMSRLTAFKKQASQVAAKTKTQIDRYRAMQENAGR
eukprot:gnl/Spiro4/5815_TR2967_c0_g2_i1.p1 gnl/Spiro4/5815_TR2967_c0_g2~~gnl/Spiro4/5815_TR2967_c0_g2_i1.p1  ORF type:complete len:1022 (+),score=471.90 gnl/Spiro4/5815_TR2967_c0_g2_i1:174-3239(+)